MDKFSVKRIGAVVMDNVAIVCLSLGLLINKGVDNEKALLSSGAIFLVCSILSPILSGGYHLGKYMLGIKIVKDDYSKPSVFQFIIRELSKMMYTIPLIGVGLVLISNLLINKREDKKTLHDLIAKTRVVGV